MEGQVSPHFPGPLQGDQKEANRDDDSGYEPSIGDPGDFVENKPSDEAKGRDTVALLLKVSLLVMTLLKKRSGIAMIYFTYLKTRNAPFAKKQNRMHFQLGE